MPYQRINRIKDSLEIQKYAKEYVDQMKAKEIIPTMDQISDYLATFI